MRSKVIISFAIIAALLLIAFANYAFASEVSAIQHSNSIVSQSKGLVEAAVFFTIGILAYMVKSSIKN